MPTRWGSTRQGPELGGRLVVGEIDNGTWSVPGGGGRRCPRASVASRARAAARWVRTAPWPFGARRLPEVDEPGTRGGVAIRRSWADLGCVARRGVHMSGVEGRTVIVTGAGQGIGRGMALHLAKHGAAVVVVDWKEHRVERTVGEVREASEPRRSGSRPTSVTTTRSRRWWRPSVERFGRVDGLINNAHTFTPKAALLDLDGRRHRREPGHGEGNALGHAGGASAHARRRAGVASSTSPLPPASPAWPSTARTTRPKRRSAP